MRRHGYSLFFVGILILVSLACNAFAGQPVEPTLPRPDTTGDGGVSVLPTAVIQDIAPTATLPGGLPTRQPTAVAEPVAGDASLTALVDVNIRLGPGVQYARDSFLLKGETAVVLGRHAESGWWKIVCPERADGNVCWVSGGSQYTRVTSAAEVEMIAAPPTPIPKPTAAATAAAAANDSTESRPLSGEDSALTANMPRLVYVHEGALWLLPLDESEPTEPTRLVTTEGEVTGLALAPNGRYAAYLTQQDTRAALHLVYLDTGESQTLIDAADLADIAPSDNLSALIGQIQWLADSRALAFNTYTVDRMGGPGSGSQEDLWTVDLDGTLTERFPAGAGGGSFAISSEGMVLLGQKTAVVRADLENTNAEVLVEFPIVNTASEYWFFPQLQWHNGGQEAHAVISAPEPFTEPYASLWQASAQGPAEQQPDLSGIVLFQTVQWSADGRRLGYVRDLISEPAAVVLANGDGTNAVDYTDDNVLRFFSWNPSGSHFVYAGQNYYAVGQADNEPLIIDIAEGRTAVAAQWLTDNTFIIALGAGNSWDFRQQTVAGPATRLITGSTTPLFDAWTP